MIIDFIQSKDNISVSYVTENNQIGISEIVLKNGFYKYVECENYDINKIENLTSFKGKSIKKESTHYFNHHNINEFFAHDIPKNYKEQYELFKLSNIPNPFSFDIETDITDETGYSSPEKAENRILSISFTDASLNSILFCVKDSKKLPHYSEGSITDLAKIQITQILQDVLGDYAKIYPFEFEVRVFDTEQEMLSTFLECMNKYFHLLIGWNCLVFDWQYIYNRCVNLGISPTKASPLQRCKNKKVVLKKKTKSSEEVSVILKMPSHRIICDYMSLFKESLIYNNLDSYSLNSIAALILDLQKVSYDGNLRTLYEKDYVRFLAYALVDTILVMLIHQKTNLIRTDFFQSFYTGVPYLEMTQNSISEALVYQELRKNNIFLLETEKNIEQKREYVGAYVKNPTRKIVGSVMGVDFSGLYPNTMITMGLSPEAKIDSIKVDKNGKPINDSENKKMLKYLSQGFCITPLGRVYDVSQDFLYTRIEKNLLSQRKIFKAHEEDIYLNIIPKIEKEIEKRKQLQQS